VCGMLAFCSRRHGLRGADRRCMHTSNRGCYGSSNGSEDSDATADATTPPSVLCLGRSSVTCVRAESCPAPHMDASVEGSHSRDLCTPGFEQAHSPLCALVWPAGSCLCRTYTIDRSPLPAVACARSYSTEVTRISLVHEHSAPRTVSSLTIAACPQYRRSTSRPRNGATTSVVAVIRARTRERGSSVGFEPALSKCLVRDGEDGRTTESLSYNMVGQGSLGHQSRRQQSESNTLLDLGKSPAMAYIGLADIAGYLQSLNKCSKSATRRPREACAS